MSGYRLISIDERGRQAVIEDTYTGVRKTAHLMLETKVDLLTGRRYENLCLDSLWPFGKEIDIEIEIATRREI